MYNMDLVNQLRHNNVNIAKVYNIIGIFFWSMENVPFTKRALNGEFSHQRGFLALDPHCHG